MYDGWSGPTRRSIINFLIYYDKVTIFHTSIDASDKIHDSNYILGLMRDVVDEIGEEYIIQVVTNNGANYMNIRKTTSILDPLYNTLYRPDDEGY